VVQFEKDPYQGMPSGMRLSGRFEIGFSRWGRGASLGG